MFYTRRKKELDCISEIEKVSDRIRKANLSAAMYCGEKDIVSESTGKAAVALGEMHYLINQLRSLIE